MPFPYATPEDYIRSAEAGGADALDLSNLDEPEANTPDQNIIYEALEQGAREIEGILAVRYPIAELRAVTPAIQALTDINVTLARYFLDVRYGARDDVRKRYEDTLARLRRIAKGQEEILLEDGSPLVLLSDTKPAARGRVGRGRDTFNASGVRALMNYSR